MRVLSDPEQYYNLQREVKGQFDKQTFSNCYLTADILAYHVSRRNIQYFPLSNGIGFLIDRGTAYIFQFCLTTVGSIVLPPVEKTVVAELIYHAGEIPVSQQAAERQLTQAGMHLRKEQHEYAIGKIPEEVREKNERLLQKLEKEGYRFQPVNVEYAGEAYRLLKTGIAPFDVYGFQEMNWERLCALQQAVCIISPQGKMCAVSVLPQGFRGGLTVVSESFRGIGLGKAIEFYGLFVIGNHFTNAYIWTASDNYTNQHIMLAMGGRDTLRRAGQYVKAN